MSFVTTSAGQFRVLTWGDDAAKHGVLLVHGFNQTAHSWEEVAPRLAEHGRVVAFDQRGHGESLRAPGAYGRQTMTDDVSQIADAVGLSRVSVVGMSMGAVHSLCFAAQQPERLARLVVVDYAPEVETGGVDKIKMMLSRTWSSFDEAVSEVRMFNPRRSEENIRKRLQHTIMQEDGRWRWKVDYAIANERRFHADGSEEMWRVVEQVKCPTLLVRGEQSDLLSEGKAAQMLSRLPRGQMATVAGAGHSVAGDNPDGFVAAVGAFLRG